MLSVRNSKLIMLFLCMFTWSGCFLLHWFIKFTLSRWAVGGYCMHLSLIANLYLIIIVIIILIFQSITILYIFMWGKLLEWIELNNPFLWHMCIIKCCNLNCLSLNFTGKGFTCGWGKNHGGQFIIVVVIFM